MAKVAFANNIFIKVLILSQLGFFNIVKDNKVSASALCLHLKGMLDGVESQIRTFFSANPRAEFVSSDMSSYERLLAHAASKYNRLISRSEYRFSQFSVMLHIKIPSKGTPSDTKFFCVVLAIHCFYVNVE